MSALDKTITVVIPLYNKAAHIVDTLKSILRQTTLPEEIIIVDDGSTDNSVKTLESFLTGVRARCDIRIIKQKNGGVSKARNTGIKHAKSNFIALLDADDSWAPDYLAEIKELMGSFPDAGAYATNYYKLEGDKYIVPKIRFTKNSKHTRIMNDYFEIAARGDLPFMTSSICIRRSVLLYLGGFPVGEPMGEDQDVWARLSLESSIAYSHKRVSHYHLDATNRACNSNAPKEECPFSKRLKIAVQINQVKPNLRRHVLAYTATHLLHLAKQQIELGGFTEAENLLADERCNLLMLKKLRLQTKLAAYKMRGLVGRLVA